MAAMTKWERVRAALAGQEVDRVPAGFRGHDYIREWTPQGLADATLERARRCDWDFIKVNPRATCYAEAWGSTHKPSGDAARGPLLVDYVLKAAADLDKIGVLDVQQGPLGEQLQALRLIGEGLGGSTPFVQTVFSPLSVIGWLAGLDLAVVRRMMRENGEALHSALSAVTETLAAYARACLDAGASGIFFATVDWGTYDSATKEQYEEFGRPYDVPVLAAVAEGEMNILHVCRRNNMLESLLDYPVAVFNWAAEQSGNPSLADILKKTDKAVMGGIAVSTMSGGESEQVVAEVEEALAQTEGRRFMLAAGCSIPPQTPEANLRAALAALSSGEGAPSSEKQ
jgi:uroporphyrinogen decarboxylase